jgi:hypothetical protein
MDDYPRPAPYDPAQDKRDKRLVGIPVLLVVLAGILCWAYLALSTRPNDSLRQSTIRVGRPDEDAIRLAIWPVSDPDPEVILIEVEVGNFASYPIGWDSEWSAFLSWRLTTSDGERIEPRQGAVVEQTKESLSRERFVLLRPGETLRKSIDLAKPLRQYGNRTRWPIMIDGAEHVCQAAVPQPARSRPGSGLPFAKGSAQRCRR